MIDFIKFYTKQNIVDWEQSALPNSFVYNSLNFCCNFFMDGNIKSYSAMDDLGLKHSINRKDEYVVSNSLHKAFNKLHKKSGNHNDFSYSNMVSILDHISKINNISLEKCYIRNFEIGINVSLKDNPMNYIEKLRSIKFTREYENMNSNAYIKPYGKKIRMSDYHIKLYDKSKETYLRDRTKLSQNIIRFELVLKRRQLIKKYLSTLEDFKNFSKYGELASFLHKTFFEISFDTKYNLDVLTHREIELYYAGSNSTYWLELNKLNRNTANTKRQKYKSIIKTLEDNNKNGDPLIIELRKKVRLKIHHMSQDILTCNITEKTT